MRYLGKGWLLGLALWLAGSATPAAAQAVILTPQTSGIGGYGGYGGWGGPGGWGGGMNPFLYGRQGNFFYGSNMPGMAYGTQQQAFQTAQSAIQPGSTTSYADQMQPGSGLPPFSTQPPPRYFFNYTPYYPLIKPGGTSGYIPQVGSPGGF